MDRLGHRRVHVMGGCIGATYCLTLCELAPERITAAVLQNPIGLHENRDTLKIPLTDVEAARMQKWAAPVLTHTPGRTPFPHWSMPVPETELIHKSN
jgi:pimeloyl-ACP methyl ester carboxylesterase